MGSLEKRLPGYCKECWEDVQREQAIETEKARQAAAEASRQEYFRELFRQSQLGERYIDCTFENFEEVPGTEVAYRQSVNFVEAFDDGANRSSGLIIYGPSGCGKSHLAASIVHELTNMGHAAVFQSVPELLARIRATYDHGSNSIIPEMEIMEGLQNCDVLVLDDMGAEKQTAWSDEKLYLLLDGRYRHRKATIITTNLEPKALEQAIGSRAMDRLLEMNKLVKMSAPSWRRRPKDAD